MLRRDFLYTSALMAGRNISSPSVPLSAPKSILEYGAKPDGKTLNTKAIQRAIDEANANGGGVVYAPPGVFLVGGLELKSRVTLYLEAGCTLLGSTSIEDYAYHPGPPIQGDANGHHLLFAGKAEDVALCGLGTIDGQGASYWEKVGRIPISPDSQWKDVATWDYRVKDGNRRPSPMVEFAECRNVRVSGVKLSNSSGWTLRPVNCNTVVIDGICIRNPSFGPNCDGIDITASTNVFVSNCDIVTGDDAICLKSENPYGGQVFATKNVTVTNCTLTTSCNGFKLGTSSAGAFENIVFSNSVIYSDPSPMNARVIGGINIEVVDGGTADGIVISNIRMQNVRAPIFVRLGERNKNARSFLRNVLVENLEATGAIFANSITGVPGLRPSDITVSNCRIRTMEQGGADWARREVPEMIDKYPEALMMGRLPAYGFFVRHADRVRLRNVECITDKPDGRPAIVADDVKDLILDALELAAPVGDAPVIELRNSHQVFLAGMRIPVGAKVLAQIKGADSSDICFAGNSFKPDQNTVTYTDGATVKALGP
jgi:polygalacturonase